MILRDHDEFADALDTLFDSDGANGGTKPVSNREQVIDRLVWILGNFYPERDCGVGVDMVARAMLATYEATLARIASEGAPTAIVMMTTDDPGRDLAARQEQAQIGILQLLRELNLVDVPSIGPVVAALTVSMLLRVPPKDRPQVAQELDRHISAFLQATPAGVVPDHDA